MKSNKIYQASTLQALALGYTKPVVTVRELLEHGDTGLGTFESVDGEMIILDGECYQAKDDGSIVQSEDTAGVPFAVSGFVRDRRSFEIDELPNLEAIKLELTLRIEEDFGLNSIHIARIDGWFEKIHARAGAPYRSQHVSLKNILSKTQKDFSFEGLYGTLVCVYFPDYMDGINASDGICTFFRRTKNTEDTYSRLLWDRENVCCRKWTGSIYSCQMTRRLIHTL